MDHLTWIIHQSGIYGEQVIWIANQFFRIEHSQLGMTHILKKDIDWSILVINQVSRQYYEGAFEDFLRSSNEEESSFTGNLAALNQVPIEQVVLPLENIGKTSVANMETTEYRLTYEWSTPQHQWKTEFRLCSADIITLPHSGAVSLFYHWSPSFRHDRAVLQSSSPDGGEMLSTRSIEQKSVSAEEFLSVPSNFERVDTDAKARGSAYIAEATASVTMNKRHD